jgi:hypothetical protein
VLISTNRTVMTYLLHLHFLSAQLWCMETSEMTNVRGFLVNHNVNCNSVLLFFLFVCFVFFSMSVSMIII